MLESRYEVSFLSGTNKISAYMQVRGQGGRIDGESVEKQQSLESMGKSLPELANN